MTEVVSCAAAEGARKIGRGVEPISNPLAASLATTIADVAHKRGVARYYIGHTSDLPGKRKQLGADSIVAVYATSDSSKAFRLTECLAVAFRRDPRSGNGSGDLYGQLAGAPYYVYVATWRRKPVPGARKRKAVRAALAAKAATVSPLATVHVADDRAAEHVAHPAGPIGGV
jgi:hypothetical protein